VKTKKTTFVVIGVAVVAVVVVFSFVDSRVEFFIFLKKNFNQKLRSKSFYVVPWGRPLVIVISIFGF
jgi:hypothetical protein